MSLNAQLIVGVACFMALATGILVWAKASFDREFPEKREEAERRHSVG